MIIVKLSAIFRASPSCSFIALNLDLVPACETPQASSEEITEIEIDFQGGIFLENFS